MAYATYTTEALVCGTKNRNTADRSYMLFTREAGMLLADARSVREERSKQRYALQDFSHTRVSLVKGKRSWKVGSATAFANHYSSAMSKEARGSVVALYRFLRRFIHGEESQPELFDYALDALVYLKGEVTSRPFVVEVVMVELLARLGYGDSRGVPGALRGCPPAEISRLYTPLLHTHIQKILDQAVSASHL